MLATNIEANEDTAIKIKSSSFVGEDRRKERRKERKEKGERKRLEQIEIETTLGRIKGIGEVWKYKE